MSSESFVVMLMMLAFLIVVIMLYATFAVRVASARRASEKALDEIKELRAYVREVVTSLLKKH